APLPLPSMFTCVTIMVHMLYSLEKASRRRSHATSRRSQSTIYNLQPALGSRRAKIGFKEGEQLLPAIDRLLLSIIRPIVVEEAMAGFRIHMERIGFAVPLEFLLQPRHLRGRGILI